MFGSTSGAFTGFGTPAPTTSQPAPTSLFGAPAASTTPSLFGAPKPATPSLFGAPAPSTPTSQPGGGGGLFGGGATATATLSKPAFSFGAPAAAPAPAGGGLFGQQPQQQQQQPGLSLGGGGGLFGQSTTAAPSGGGGLFGSTTAAGNPSLFGAPAPTQQQPQQVQQQAQASSSGLTKATKFNDLPDGARQTIEGIDAFIRSQMGISEELKTRELGAEIKRTAVFLDQYSAEATAVSNNLSQDARHASELRQKLEQDLNDLNKVTTIIEGYKNPQQKGAQAKAVSNFPYEYFERKAGEFRDRLDRYKATMDQIQSQVDSTSSLSSNPSAIVPTLRAQNTSFMALASSVASLDAQLKVLKEEYRQIWREKTGSARDPFVGKGGKAERGLEGLEIR